MTPSIRIPLPPGMAQACDGRATLQLRGGRCRCECGAIVHADVLTGAPLRHPAPVVEAFTTGIGWRAIGRGMEKLRSARGRYSAVRLAR